MREFLREIETRINACREAVARGDDVPPATLYRLEGAIDLGLRCELATREQIDALVPAENRLSGTADGYRLCFPMHTAPVYPTTSNT